MQIKANLKVKQKMKIGEIARRTGLAASAIRYYEEQGLLDAPTRDMNNYRHYSESAIERLEVVVHAQRLGFSLDTIRGLFLQDGSCSKSFTVEQINIRLQEIQQIEATLTVQREELLMLQRTLEESLRTGTAPGLACPRSAERSRPDRAVVTRSKHMLATNK
ncbi:MerR family transcriptional regulator [Pseudomonas sp. SDT2931_S440]|jgi:DNA-binding transcriptional MerR regulator|uniref:MerR family transcriptional regulator n=1 Tax=Pseudomonas protegens TaxID=380021 RepID=UPI00223BA7DF|nr:MerR family transcriptional regulator [Pseudomonas protegens]